MSYTIIVDASAASPAALQYIGRYQATPWANTPRPQAARAVRL